MMSDPSTLRMDQNFRLKILSDAAKTASREQLEDLFVEVSKQLMLKDNWMHQIFKECHFSEFPDFENKKN